MLNCRRRIDSQNGTLPKEQKAEGMVEVSIGQQNGLDRRAAPARGRGPERRKTFKLSAQIGGGIE